MKMEHVTAHWKDAQSLKRAKGVVEAIVSFGESLISLANLALLVSAPLCTTTLTEYFNIDVKLQVQHQLRASRKAPSS